MSLAMVLFVVIYGCIKIAHNEIEAKLGFTQSIRLRESKEFTRIADCVILSLGFVTG
jgi:uncharacterized membrane protein